MAIAGAIGCVAGTLWSLRISNQTYDMLLAVVLLASAILILYRPKKTNAMRNKRTDRMFALVLGCLGGVLAGTLGMSGSAPLMGGLAFLGLSAVEMIGTSAFVLPAVSLAGFLIHWRTGATDWTTTSLLLTGTLMGAWLAPPLLGRIEGKKLEKWFRPLVAGTLLLVAGFLIRSVLF